MQVQIIQFKAENIENNKNRTALSVWLPKEQSSSMTSKWMALTRMDVPAGPPPTTASLYLQTAISIEQ